jgi:hypothetical protein
LPIFIAVARHRTILRDIAAGYREMLHLFADNRM